jgi:IS30 family transposase
VDAREIFGDWEGDLMIFERAQGNMNGNRAIGTACLTFASCSKTRV